MKSFIWFLVGVVVAGSSMYFRDQVVYRDFNRCVKPGSTVVVINHDPCQTSYRCESHFGDGWGSFDWIVMTIRSGEEARRAKSQAWNLTGVPPSIPISTD